MPFWSILTPGENYFSTTIFPIEMELFAIQHSWDLRLQKQIQIEIKSTCHAIKGTRHLEGLAVILSNLSV